MHALRTPRLWLIAGFYCALHIPLAVADDPVSNVPESTDCLFCGVWTLSDDATIALQDVQLDHAALVYNAMVSLQFEMAFAPEGTACMRVERRGERANEAIGWQLMGTVNGMWRVQNVPPSSTPTEMFLALDDAGNLVMRQPARMDEPLVFLRVAPASEAAAWCAASNEVAP